MSNDHDFSPSLPYPPKPSSSIPDIDCVQDTGWRPTGHQKAAEFPRSRTANKGVVLLCRGIRKPLGHPEHDCEQGGCFVLPGYQKAAGPPEAALRTRGLFCPAGVSESRWATRSRTANKGVVLSCRGIRKPLGHPEQDCEQGGCFTLSGCHEAAGPPGAELRTRGLFCPAGVSESRWATRSSIANKGVVLSCRGIRKPLGHPEPDCEQGGCFVTPGDHKATGLLEAKQLTKMSG